MRGRVAALKSSGIKANAVDVKSSLVKIVAGLYFDHFCGRFGQAMVLKESDPVDPKEYLECKIESCLDCS